VVIEGDLEMKILNVRNGLIILIFVWAVCVVGAVSAIAQEVRYNYERGTDFSKYKTYRWVKQEEMEYPAEDIDQKIRRSIDAILSERGLKRVEDGESDLVVIYQAGLTREREWNAYKTGNSNWEYGGWYGWGGSRPRARSYIVVGTLNLDFYDAALKKQIWRGEATKTLNPPKNPMKLQAKIDKAMRRLLRNFPPRSTK
jgi:hypothetical protein